MDLIPPHPSRATIESAGVPLGGFSRAESPHLGFSWVTHERDDSERLQYIDARYEGDMSRHVVVRTFGPDRPWEHRGRADVAHLIDRIQEDVSLEEIDRVEFAARAAATDVPEGLPISADGWTVVSIEAGGQYSVAWPTGLLGEDETRACFVAA